MSKPLLAVPAVIAIFLAASCKQATTTTTTISPGASANPKTVTIRVAPDPSHPGFFTVAAEPESINISKRGHDVIKWCVDSSTPDDNTLVHVGGFAKEGDPSK